MLIKKGFSVLFVIMILVIVACQPTPEVAEPVQPVKIVESNVIPSLPEEDSTMQKVEPVILNSEQAVLRQLRQVLEN